MPALVPSKRSCASLLSRDSDDPRECSTQVSTAATAWAGGPSSATRPLTVVGTATDESRSSAATSNSTACCAATAAATPSSFCVAPQSSRARIAPEKKPLDPAGAVRVSLWNRVYQRKICGNSAPMLRHLGRYLRKHPEYEVYTDQDTRDPSDAAAPLTAFDMSQFAKPAVPIAAGMTRVALWHKLEKRKIVGNAAPLEVRFCWHGFQYVLVTDPGGKAGFGGALGDILGLETRTDLATTGTLAFGGDGAAGSASEGAADVLRGGND